MKKHLLSLCCLGILWGLYLSPTRLFADSGAPNAYQPTVFESIDQVEKIYRDLKKYKPRCAFFHPKDATITTQDSLHRDHNVRSMTAALFYTKRFRETFTRTRWDYKLTFSSPIVPFQYWLNLVPFVYVGTEEIALDTTNFRSPTKLTDWIYYATSKATTRTDVPFQLSREEAQCRVLKPGESPYNPILNATEWCLIYKFPMFNINDVLKSLPHGLPHIHVPWTRFNSYTLAQSYNKINFGCIEDVEE